MERPVESFEQVTYIVQLYTWHQLAEIARPHREAHGPRRCRCRGEALPQNLVHDLFEGSPGAPGHRTELGRDVVVKSQSGAHTLTLLSRHHDVNAANRPLARAATAPGRIAVLTRLAARRLLFLSSLVIGVAVPAAAQSPDPAMGRQGQGHPRAGDHTRHARRHRPAQLRRWCAGVHERDRHAVQPSDDGEGRARRGVLHRLRRPGPADRRRLRQGVRTGRGAVRRDSPTHRADRPGEDRPGVDKEKIGVLCQADHLSVLHSLADPRIGRASPVDCDDVVGLEAVSAQAAQQAEGEVLVEQDPHDAWRTAGGRCATMWAT